jgi:hypothetical protein
VEALNLLNAIRRLRQNLSATISPRWRIAGLSLVGVVGAATLIAFASYLANTTSGGGRGKGTDDEVGGGIIVHSEVLYIWLDPVLKGLPIHPFRTGSLESLQAYRRYADLHEPALRRAWYALTIRSTQRNGKVVVTDVIREPYSMERDRFPEFLDVLAIAKGSTRQPTTFDFTVGKVREIPKRFADGNRFDVLALLKVTNDRAPLDKDEPQNRRTP